MWAEFCDIYSPNAELNEREEIKMIKIPFCYKVWGLSVDEEGNEDYGYIKVAIDAKEKPNNEDYEKLHRAFIKLLPIQDDVELIDIQEYLDNVDCDIEELDLLLNY